MRIVIATPLYPPDISQPAPYVKELARRLAPDHEVTVVAMTYLPEPVEGVRIQVVNKRRPLPLRILALTITLIHAARAADVVIIENGASTELAGGIVARLTHTPFIMHLGDSRAHAHASRFESFLMKKARVLDDPPPSKPEILPLEEPPTADLEAYEAWWQAHIARLMDTIRHG